MLWELVLKAVGPKGSLRKLVEKSFFQSALSRSLVTNFTFSLFFKSKYSFLSFSIFLSPAVDAASFPVMAISAQERKVSWIRFSSEDVARSSLGVDCFSPFQAQKHNV